MNISRQTASTWWGRYVREGTGGLVDRSSRPRRSPHRTPPEFEQQILALRTQRKLGPARIAGILGMAGSTVHRVLVRHQVNRLSWMDRPTGRVIRRSATSRCGELVHIDVKKLARIPTGGGHRMLGLIAGTPHQRAGTGYTHLHSAIELSMGSIGDPWDNAVAETFFASLEKELLRRERFATREHARMRLFWYIECFYNTRRRHSGLGYLSPAEYEARHQQEAIAA